MEAFVGCYDDKRHLTFIASPELAGRDGSEKRCVVFIHGLSDGFLAVPYLAALAAALRAAGTLFAQVPLLDSQRYAHCRPAAPPFERAHRVRRQEPDPRC